MKSESYIQRCQFLTTFKQQISVLRVFWNFEDVDITVGISRYRNCQIVWVGRQHDFYDKDYLLFLLILPIWDLIDSLMNSDVLIFSSTIVSIRFLYCCSVILIVTDFFLFFFISSISSCLVILGWTCSHFFTGFSLSLVQYPVEDLEVW